MSKNNNSQSGVGHLVLLLAVVIVAAAGFVGYRVWSQNQDEVAEETTSSQAAVPQINNASDLDQAASVAEQATVDNDLDPTQFDADVDDLL